MSFYIP